MKKFIIFLLFISIACSDDSKDDINCTEEFVPGLVVTVKDATSGSILKEGVTVMATEGNFTEELEVISQNSSDFYGAFERKGNYILTASKEGYKTYTSGVIQVDADRCHVFTEKVTIALEKV